MLFFDNLVMCRSLRLRVFTGNALQAPFYLRQNYLDTLICRRRSTLASKRFNFNVAHYLEATGSKCSWARLKPRNKRILVDGQLADEGSSVADSRLSGQLSE